MKLVVDTTDEMEMLGEKLGKVAEAGDVIVLSGELGAGKTTFARGFGRALALTAPVSSPTFVVARTHTSDDPARPPLVHIDAYRLSSVLELEDLDIDVPHSIVVAEWGAPFAEVLSPDWFEVHLVRPEAGELIDFDADEPRTVTLVCHGPHPEKYDRLVNAAVGA